MRSSTIIALFAVGLAACSESVTAPPSAGFDLSEPLMAKGSSSGSGSGNSGSGSSNSGRGLDAGSRSFTVWPGIPVFEKFGDHVLTMPANVVCDPATSGYGAAHWDAPCARATRPIEVIATWATRGGRPVISFSPDLRFAPSSSQSHWVNLSLRDPRKINPELYYTILWYDREAGRWVDESEADPSLRARAVGNLVSRRLKHFSEWA
ncbi:MAG: hypothetical protein M3303_11125, partial [Gemmatimonadota bacterium]|nr:hypothetical protein [Gemmatimonadota bacterium]